MPNHRFRFRFSLRTLLLGVTILGFLLFPLAHKLKLARDQRTAVDEIVKLGGYVKYDREQAKGEEKGWLRRILGDDFFDKVVEVGMRGRPISDSDLRHLEKLHGLRMLYLTGTPISDDAGPYLSQLKQLTFLQLQRTPVTNTVLPTITQLINLQSLHLGQSGITDPDPEVLSRLEKLEIFSLNATDTGIARLEFILGKLRWLSVHGDEITDDSVETLKHCDKLERLYVDETQITGAGVATLQAALPNCRITGPPPAP